VAVIAMATIPLPLPEVLQNLSYLSALWATFILILAFHLHATFHVSWA
jgi:hypothetical protein